MGENFEAGFGLKLEAGLRAVVDSTDRGTAATAEQTALWRDRLTEAPVDFPITGNCVTAAGANAAGNFAGYMQCGDRVPAGRVWLVRSIVVGQVNSELTDASIAMLRVAQAPPAAWAAGRETLNIANIRWIFPAGTPTREKFGAGEIVLRGGDYAYVVILGKAAGTAYISTLQILDSPEDAYHRSVITL